LAAGHKAPLNQVGEEGVRDFLAIRKSIGYSVPEGQPLYNMSTFAGYTLGKAGK
jgi:L-fuculose-phosphate aldolase